MLKSNVFEFVNPQKYKNQLKLDPLFNEDQLKTHFIHHQKYYDDSVKLIAKENLEEWSVEKLLSCTRGTIQNNISQWWYHQMFWNNLTKEDTDPSEQLKAVIENTYGSMNNLKECFISTAESCFGSGWYVFGFHRHYKDSIRCMIFKNSDVPMHSNIVPLFVVDMWEHARYLQYKTSKREYLENIWTQLDWNVISERHRNWKDQYKDYKSYWM